MSKPSDDEGPIYYGHIADQMRATLDSDSREPKFWSDGNKLRLLAALFDEADMLKGNTGRDVQIDLRRMATRLERLDESNSEWGMDPLPTPTTLHQFPVLRAFDVAEWRYRNNFASSLLFVCLVAIIGGAVVGWLIWGGNA